MYSAVLNQIKKVCVKFTENKWYIQV